MFLNYIPGTKCGITVYPIPLFSNRM